MTETLQFWSDTPDRVDARFDVLADVLDTMRVSSLLYRRLELGAPWGLRVPVIDLANFYVVARGSAILEIDGEAPVSLSAGDLVMFSRGVSHVLRDGPRSDVVPLDEGACWPNGSSSGRFGGAGPVTVLAGGCFVFDGHGSTLLDRLSPIIILQAHDPAAGPTLAATVQLFLAESAAPRPGTELVMSRLADVLLVQVLRANAARSSCPEEGLRGLADPHVGRALALIHARPGEGWTVDRLSAAVGMSRSGFAARFTSLVGASPLEYVTRWRMRKAARLLEDTDLGLKEIGARLGYSSIPAFSKAFKREEGATPFQHRAVARERRDDRGRVPLSAAGLGLMFAGRRAVGTHGPTDAGA
ncbi:MAG: AraC family transcriptional regulator [Myxococcota bacterium]